MWNQTKLTDHNKMKLTGINNQEYQASMCADYYVKLSFSRQEKNADLEPLTGFFQ